MLSAQPESPNVATPVITLVDPVAVVEQLDADVIAARLDALDREAAALRVLYKAAKAKERRRSRPDPKNSPPRGAAA